jgi:hypothetical protein
MKRWTVRSLSAAILTGLVLTAGARLAAQDLPKGEDILDKYIEVTGGKEAYLKLNNRVAKGTFSLPAAGLEGTIALYQAAPTKLYALVDLGAVGKSEEGVSGDVAWENSSITGAKLKTGGAKAAALRAAAFHADVKWRDHYTKAKCVGEEKVEGKDCYKVELTPKEGKVATRWFDKKTGLLVKGTTLVETGKDEDLKTDVYVSGYKKVDGILVAHKSKIEALGVEIVLEFKSVEHNTKLPADRFELPAEIKKLVDKSGQ